MLHKGTVKQETTRLILRPSTEEDAPSVFRNWANGDEVTKYLTRPTHKSAEASRGHMKYCVENYKQKTSYQWGCVLKESGELIGNCCLLM